MKAKNVLWIGIVASVVLILLLFWAASGLRAYHAMLLRTNAVFILLHLLQPRFFCDGLAQFVPAWTSQYLVILYGLVFVIMGLYQGVITLFHKEKRA